MSATPTPVNVIELIPRGAAEFGSRVQLVSPARWDDSTPCTKWSVRDLVGHLVSEHLWVPDLLAGKTIEEVGNRYDGDVLGDDPIGAWNAAIQGSLAAWSEASEDQTVHLSFGDAPAHEYAEQMLSDLVIHAWDLARGAGLDEHLDGILVEHVYSYLEPQARQWSGMGVFAAPVDVDPGSGLQDLLLGLTGRKP
ncbi:TIGR03086 family metal-binding protein [Flindersiella endophytica]